MSTRKLLKKPKPKQRTDDETKRLVNEKYIGKVPPPITDRARFLTWCTYMVDLSTARKWLEEFWPGALRGVPDKWINASVCYRARLKTLGAPFTDSQDWLLESGIEAMQAHVQETEDTDQAPRPTIADHVREKFSEVMGELEGMFDDGFPKDFDITTWYVQNNVSPTIAAKILAKLEPRLDEMLAVAGDEDPQLVEAYERVSMDDFDNQLDWLRGVYNDTSLFVSNSKKARVARKPKPVSVEKKLKHMADAYQKHSKDFNITSIDPAKIIGAKELWTLNTKYKLLTVYRAESHGGQLDVSRCKVTGFNRNDSHTYRLGRGKSALTLLDNVIKSSKSALKRLTSDLKEAPLAERINENTVLLRV
jgi:hypothetical protein